MLALSSFIRAIVHREPYSFSLLPSVEAKSATCSPSARYFRSQHRFGGASKAHASHAGRHPGPDASRTYFTGHRIVSQKNRAADLIHASEFTLPGKGIVATGSAAHLHTFTKGQPGSRDRAVRPTAAKDHLLPGPVRVQKWLLHVKSRLAQHANHPSRLATSISGILAQLEGLPPSSVAARTHDVADTVVHVLYAIPDTPKAIPAHLLSLSSAIRLHPILGDRLFSMPAPVFHNRVRDLMHAAAGAALSYNGVMMLARAQVGLRCHCRRMWQRLDGHRFDKFPPVGVAVVLNSAATAATAHSHPPPAPPVLRALADAFAGHCWEDSVTPRAVSMCLWALGTFQIDPLRQDYRAWQHALTQHAPGMNGREVSAVWVACDRLQWVPERTAWQQLEEATARELGAGSRNSPRTRPGAAADADSGHGRAVDAVGIVTSWVAWASLGVMPSPPVERAMIDTLAAALPGMHSWHASMSLRSLAKLSRTDAGDALGAAYARIDGLLRERRTLGAWDASAVLYALACIVAVRHRGHPGSRAPEVASPAPPAPDAQPARDPQHGSTLVQHVHSILRDGAAPPGPPPQPRARVGRLQGLKTGSTAPADAPAASAAASAAHAGDSAELAVAGLEGDLSMGAARGVSGSPWETWEEGRDGAADEGAETALARRVLAHAARLYRAGRQFENEALVQIHAACCVLQLTPESVAAATVDTPGGSTAEGAADADWRLVRNLLKKARTVAGRDAVARAAAAPAPDRWRQRRQLQEAVAQAAQDRGFEVQRQVLLDGGTVCADMLASAGGQQVALEFVSPLHVVTNPGSSRVVDGATWLRAARMRQCGVEVVHVHIPRRGEPDLQQDHLVGVVMNQLHACVAGGKHGAR